jgi:excisionase family DNA binding protein
VEVIQMPNVERHIPAKEIERHFRTGEVAKMLNVSPHTVRLWLRQAKLASVQPTGNIRLIPESALKTFLQRSDREIVGL